MLGVVGSQARASSKGTAACCGAASKAALLPSYSRAACGPSYSRAACGPSYQRERARDDDDAEQSSRCRLLGKAKEASIRELQLKEEEEREARENHQWRKPGFAGLTIGWGWGGSKASPTESGGGGDSRCRPLGRASGKRRRRSDDSPSLLGRPTRAGKRGKGRKRKLPVPPPRGTRGGEHPVTDDDDLQPNVKPARTNSGGSPACWADDWMGVWGKQRFPQWRKVASAT